MKKKQYLIATLPAVITAVVIGLNVLSMNKVSSLYAKAANAVQEKNYTTATEYLNDLYEVAPGYAQQYELAAQIKLDSNNLYGAYEQLQTGIRQTGSHRLIRLAKDVRQQIHDLYDPEQPDNELPNVKPEDWETENADQEGTTQAPYNKQYINLSANFIVRYPQSDYDRQVQLEIPDYAITDGEKWEWASSNTLVATVDDTGSVTCTSNIGEAKITAKSDNGKIGECWVCVVEPDIYANDGTEIYQTSDYFYIPEGEFNITFGGGNIDAAIANTQHGSTMEVLPHIGVTGDNLQASGLGQGDDPAKPVTLALGTVDENGNPIDTANPTPSPQETTEDGGDIGIQLGWESIYFSGEYRIPTQLRSNGKTYTTTSVNIYASNNTSITSLYIPAGIVSISQNMQVNPFSGYNALERFEVEEGNTAFKSVDGVLMSADGKTLISYPNAAIAQEYTIPDGVTSIATGAFMNNINLKSIRISASVTDIAYDAFEGMKSLEKLELDPNNPALVMQDGVITDKGGSTILATSPQDMSEEYTVKAGVTQISPSAFCNMTKLKQLTLDASVGSIELNGCGSLEKLFINGTMANLMVSNCPNLSQIVVNNSVSGIQLIGTEKNKSVHIEANAEIKSFFSSSVPVELINSQNITQNLSVAVSGEMSMNFAPSLQDVRLYLKDAKNAFDLSALENCTALSGLEISGGDVTGMATLEKLSNLNRLTLNDVSVDDWSPIWKCSNLYDLSVTSSDLDDISGVAALSELQNVSFFDTDIQDVSALANCSKLTRIDLSKCRGVKDVSVLKDLPALVQLNLNETGVPAEQQMQIFMG